MNCLKCGTKLKGKQEKYCSQYCCKLYLKSLYRKKYREKINYYKRQKSLLGIRGDGKELKNRFVHLKSGECFVCGVKSNLEVHHLKPRDLGGLNTVNNLMLLCKKCHFLMENSLRKLWEKGYGYSPLPKIKPLPRQVFIPEIEKEEDIH